MLQKKNLKTIIFYNKDKMYNFIFKSVIEQSTLVYIKKGNILNSNKWILSYI